ncbi:MAG: hypothetical protein GVY17_11895 [Cyanobacteria bacterium]|nr:hypothetical protein [Cyanobacteria bacterium GSL.Bin21]
MESWEKEDLKAHAYFVWLHSIPEEARRANYSVHVEPQIIEFANLEDEVEISIEVRSNRDFPQYFYSMSCAWFVNFATHNKVVELVYWPCRANIHTREMIEPHGKWSKRVKIKLARNFAEGEFRIYFYPLEQLASWAGSKNGKRELDYYFESNLVRFRKAEPVGGANGFPLRGKP